MRSICVLAINDATPDTVTDEALEQYLDSLLSNETVTMEDLTLIVQREVKYDMGIVDVNGRLIQLISDMERVSKEHGLAVIFRSDSGKKLKTKLLISRLEGAAEARRK